MLRQGLGRNLLVFALCLAFVGCLSFSLDFGGRRSSPCDDHVLTQSGSATVSHIIGRTIYYPVAYHSPPNLEIEAVWRHHSDRLVLVAQERDHFRVECKNDRLQAVEFKWTARGLPVTVSLPASPIVVVPAVPGPPSVPPGGPFPNPLPPVAP